MSYFGDVLALSPEAFWEMQETVGTSAADASGNGHGGTYQAGGGSFTLGQATSYAECPFDVLFVPGGRVDPPSGQILFSSSDYTLLALINSTAVGGAFDRTIYGEAQGSGSFHYFRLTLDASTKKLSFERNGTNGAEIILMTSGAALNDGNDHLVAVVVSGLTVALYVDGVAVTTTGSITGTVTTSGVQANIAALTNVFGGTARNFDGEIASVAGWRSALTPTQILNLFTSLQGGGCTPPTNVTPPLIAGGSEVGDTETVTPGTWSGDATIVLTYQWYRFCGSGPEELIVGETNTTYVLAEADEGCDIFVRETATNSCPPAGTEDSNHVGPVTCGAPSEITPPTIVGVLASGHTLTGFTGTFTCDPTDFAYQWYLDCGGGPNPILGETNITITTDDTMVGCTLILGETPSSGSLVGAESFSAPFGPIQASVPAPTRFREPPPWRFVVLDLNTFETLSFLDHLATEKSVTYVLNQPAIAVGKVPSDEPEVNIPWPAPHSDPFLAEGNRALLGFRREGGTPNGPWVIRYTGRIEQLEDVAESDNAFSHYTAYDPLRYLFSRPVRNGADFSYTLPGVDGSSYTATRIDVIIGEIIHNTIVEDGFVGIDAGPLYGGTALWGGVIQPCDQIDINFSQGTTVGEAIQQLTSMNECDIILTPIYDPINRPGYLSELSIFTQAGSTIDDAIFAWDKPSRNLDGISRLIDGTTRANQVKMYAGQGGSATDGQNIPVKTDAASLAKFGSYFYQQFWPGQNVAGAVELLAESALAIRKDGRTTVAISPEPARAPIPFQEFYLGDRVPVYASKRFRQPIPPGGAEGIEYQRIYGIPILIADDETERIQSMLTSVQS